MERLFVIINQHDGTLVTLSNVATAFVKQYEEIKKSTLVRHSSYPVQLVILYISQGESTTLLLYNV